MPDATGIILAGGKGSRIKKNKALITLPDGRTLIQRCMDTLRVVCGEILIVTNEMMLYQSLDARVVEDMIKDKGPLGGIFTGLSLSQTQCNFVMGCDMPFPQPELIKILLGECDDHDVVIPEVDGEIEPLFAVYSRNCLPVISEQIENEDLKIRKMFGRLRVKKIGDKRINAADPNHLSFFNINTEEDLIRARKLGECSSGPE